MAEMDLSEETFDNVCLNQQFRYLGLHDGKSSQGDSPRPQKRRKISTDPVTDPGQKILNEMIGNMHRLFGSQVAEDLDGIENLAV